MFGKKFLGLALITTGACLGMPQSINEIQEKSPELAEGIRKVEGIALDSITGQIDAKEGIRF